jgi:hypothetical protein
MFKMKKRPASDSVEVGSSSFEVTSPSYAGIYEGEPQVPLPLVSDCLGPRALKLKFDLRTK